MAQGLAGPALSGNGWPTWMSCRARRALMDSPRAALLSRIARQAGRSPFWIRTLLPGATDGGLEC